MRYLVVLLLAGCTQRQAGPLFADPAQQRLPDTMWSADVEFEFDVVNLTKEHRTIKKINMSCGCTPPVRQYVGQEIEPGERLPLVFSWNVKSESGDFERSATITFDDESKVRSSMNATVYGTYDVSTGEIAKFPSTVTVSSDYGVEITRVTPTVDWLNVVVNGGQQFDVTVIPDRLWTGINSGAIIIDTNCEIKPRTIISAVYIQPERQLRPFPKRAYGEQVVRFFEDGRPVTIASVTTEGAATASIVDGSVKVGGEGKVHVVTDKGVEGFVLVYEK